jgi:hypothetical protein
MTTPKDGRPPKPTVTPPPMPAVRRKMTPPPMPRVAAPAPEEVDEAAIVAEAVPEVPPLEASRLDFWFGQAVHGYCPPPGAAASRPAPPTTFPGRNEPP